MAFAIFQKMSFAILTFEIYNAIIEISKSNIAFANSKKGVGRIETGLCEGRFGNEAAAADQFGLSQQGHVRTVNGSICPQ